jgi:glycopeptide antibiotics resistance protein
LETQQEEINLVPFQSGVGLLNLLNIIMFTPLGFLLPLVWKHDIQKIQQTNA